MFTGPPVKFSIPSKTFLLGEYLALQGGSALVLGHGPYFECEFSGAVSKGVSRSSNEDEDEDVVVPGSAPKSHRKSDAAKLAGSKPSFPFHQDSPAGIWAELHEEFFDGVTVQFTDPYAGAGGFGASTAQFFATYLYVLSRQDMLRNGANLSDTQKWAIVEDYRQLFEEENVQPSGYDLMAQMNKGLCLVNGNQNKNTSVTWPFADLELHIFKTPSKVNTHEHLQNLKISASTAKSLSAAVDKTISALNKKDKQSFVAGIKEFTGVLEKSNWIAPATLELIRQWEVVPGVLAAKGCGALGADVFAVFAEKTFSPSAELTKNLKPVWSSREGFA